MKIFLLLKHSAKALAAGWLVMLFAAALFIFTGCESGQPTGIYAPLPVDLRPPEAPQHVRTQPLILSEGDVVNVTFPGSSTLDTTQQIRRDGKIVLPLVGEVMAAGKTPEKLQKELIKMYAPQVATKQVVVTVQSSSFQVYVTGAVLKPGKVLADRPTTALDAVMQAGGFDYSKANLEAVEVIRQEQGGTKKFTLNLKEAMQGGNEKPFYLKPSDIVYVPEKFTWF